MEVPVRPDGRISLPLVAEISASGLTPVELSRQLEERLKEYVREPNVTVIVRSSSWRESSTGVRPDAEISATSGSEMRPSGRTGTSMLSSGDR
jgi:polysaccharide export outer membrane protein